MHNVTPSAVLLEIENSILRNLLHIIGTYNWFHFMYKHNNFIRNLKILLRKTVMVETFEQNTRISHRDSFRKYLFFFSKSNLFIIFQEGLYVLRTDTMKRHIFSRRFYLFVEQTLLSHRTDTNFPRNPYLVVEHIRIIFRTLYFLIEQILIFQEALSSSRTHTIFQETPMPRTHRHFPGRYPPSNRYFVKRSRWLLSKYGTSG